MTVCRTLSYSAFHFSMKSLQMPKIVYVEDDADIGQLITTYLGKHDIDVIIESRGDTAQQCVEREQPDLVMLDIMLPGKDGMTLCRDLRLIYSGPIVLLTSFVLAQT